jgi:uncharacterized protein
MRSKEFRLPRKKIAEFCKRWSITEFSVFGSVLREDLNPDSDIDVWVSIDPQALRECLQPEATTRAHEVAGRMELRGARIGAERLTNEFG